MTAEPTPAATPAWTEHFLGGSETAELAMFQRFGQQIQALQDASRARDASAVTRRGFHAKMHVGTNLAFFLPAADVPPSLRQGIFLPVEPPGYPTTVRFSNATSQVRPDNKREGRGIALRIGGPDGEHDLLLSNSPTSHARDAAQFMSLAAALAGPKIAIPFKLLRDLGPGETLHLLSILMKSGSVVPSLATETFWSRTAYAFGREAIKLRLNPDPSLDRTTFGSGDDFLRDDLLARLAAGPLQYTLTVQQFADDRSTPIEDGTVAWPEEIAPNRVIGTLVIPSQDASRASRAEVDAMAFNPWHVPSGVRPLGSLNRARRPVYEASANHRQDRRAVGARIPFGTSSGSTRP